MVEELSERKSAKQGSKAARTRKLIPGVYQTQKFENSTKSSQLQTLQNPMDYDHEKYQQLGTQRKLNQLLSQKQDTPSNSSKNSAVATESPERPIGAFHQNDIPEQSPSYLDDKINPNFEQTDQEEWMFSSNYQTDQ